MTDPRISAPDDEAPISTDEAAEIVEHDPALNAATQDSREDAATDEEAKGTDN
jgi:hypothetical protein